MATPVIIDAIVVIILVAFVVYGTFRGALRTLAGLLIVVIALAGAGMIASACSGPAAKLAAPLVERRIAERVRSAMDQQAAETGGELPEEFPDLPALLERLGLDEAAWQPLLERVQKSVTETGTEIADAVVESLIHSVIYAILFLLAFLILLILLKLLVKALDLITLLPVLHGLNALLGGVLGFIEGGLLLFLAVWVARKFGVSFETELFEGAYILEIFTANTPLGVLSFLH